MTDTYLRRVALTAALLIALATSLVACSPTDDGESDASSDESTTTAEATVTTEPDAGAAPAVEGDWQTVTLATGGLLIGRTSDLTDDTFLVLDDTYFLQAPADEDEDVDVNTLARFGSEIHKPLPRTHVPWTTILFAQPLHPDSPALAAIAVYEADDPEPEVPDESALGDSMKAVFALTGDVFFGFVDTDGATVTVRAAYVIQFKDAEQAELGEIESLDDLELVPASSQGLGALNVIVLPLDKVLYLQTLAVDSPVVGALGAQ